MSVIAQLLPFALAGALLPSWTSRVIVLLGTERPLSTSSAYVLGNAVWRLILGFTVIFVVPVAAPETQHRGFAVPAGLALTLATVLAVAGAWLLIRQPVAAVDRPKRLPGWIGALRRIPPWAAFGYGAYNCALPGVQWVYFLGGCALIASSGLAWEWQIGLLVMFVTLLEVMLVVPILIYTRKRNEVTTALAHFEAWIAGRATSAFGGILILMGALFAYVALMGGRIGGTR